MSIGRRGRGLKLMKIIMGLTFILGILQLALLSSCVPQNTSNEVKCDPGQTFNPVTRKCEAVQIIRNYTLLEGESKQFLIDTENLVYRTPLDCEVLSEGEGIDVTCGCTYGKCYAEVSPDIHHSAYPNFEGNSNFVFRIFDGVQYSGNVWANVIIENVPDVPFAYDQEITFSEGTVFVGQLNGGDPDSENSVRYEITLYPNHGQLEVDSDGQLKLDLSASAPGNDLDDIKFEGDDLFRYRVISDDGFTSREATVSIHVTHVRDDAPVITDASILELQNTLNADSEVREENTFTIRLPFVEYDTGDVPTSCEVDLDPSTPGTLDIESDKLKMSACECKLISVLEGYGCFLTVTGKYNQFGETSFLYRIQTGEKVDDESDPDSEENLWTNKKLVTFFLDDINDPPWPVDQRVWYSNTLTHSSAMQIAFKVNNAIDVDSGSDSFTYTIDSLPTNGTLTGCISGTTLSVDQTCFYTPNDTTLFATQWRRAKLAIDGITFWSLERGSSGNNISIEVKAIATLLQDQVKVDVTGNEVTIYISSTGGATAQAVYDALSSDDQVRALLVMQPYYDYEENSGPLYFQAHLRENLSGGTDGLDSFAYTVKDSQGAVSIAKGRVYISAQGLVDSSSIVYVGHESETNIPDRYPLTTTFATASHLGNYTRIYPTDSDIISPESFSFDCLTDTTQSCDFTPIDGDVNGVWTAASGTNQGITYTARRKGARGNHIVINLIDDSSINRGEERVEVTYSHDATTTKTINVHICATETGHCKDISQGNDVKRAIDNNPLASGLVSVTVSPSSNLSAASLTLSGGTNGVRYVRYWYSDGTPENEMGILYINLTASDENAVMYYDSPTLCHYGAAFKHPTVCDESGCLGSSRPSDSKLNSATGKMENLFYYEQDSIDDPTDDKHAGALCYQSKKDASDNYYWDVVTSKNLNLGANYGELGDLTFLAFISDQTYTVRLVDGGVAGSESVTLDGTTITVAIEGGVSTAGQIRDAINISALSSPLIYAVVSAYDENNPQSTGEVVLSQSSGDEFTINENDKVVIDRIRLDEGDGDDFLNGRGCVLESITSSNETLVPTTNVSIELGGVNYPIGSTFTLGAGVSLDTQDIKLVITPAAGLAGQAVVEAVFKCNRPTLGELTGACQDGADCTAIKGDPYVAINFLLTVKEAGIAHNGWKNVIALGPKVDKYGLALDSCPYDSTGCNGSECIGDTVPLSVVTPSKAGLFYYDRSTSHCYVSTGTTTSDWENADCSVSYSYDEPECNGSSTDVEKCIGTSAPTFTPKKRNSLYYDRIAQKCYRSVGTSGSSDWKVYLRSANVRLEWESFTLMTFGQSIEGYNVYRRFVGEEFNYETPINREIIPADVKFYEDNIKNSWQAPVPGTVYEYEVRPIINGIPTTGGYTVYKTLKVTVPPPNMAFVSRRIVNKSMCTLMGKTPDKLNYNRCEYRGPGSDGTYYDIGSDYLVDRFEIGCPYSKAPACDSANGCIGVSDPTSSAPSAANNTGEIYYSRTSGRCYKSDGTNWNLLVAGDISGRLGGIDSAANVFISRLAHLPPFTNIDQTTANDFCSAQTSLSATDILGIASGNTVDFKLPNRLEQVAYSLWDDEQNTDIEIADIEQGLNLNSSPKCNSSAGNGLESSFVDSDVPPVSVHYTLPGTASSNIRSFYTGSDQTATCVSRFGIQDVVGNVAEWTQDRLFCPSPYICAFVQNSRQPFPHDSGSDYEPDPSYINNWSWQDNSITFCEDGSGNEVKCYGSGVPSSVIPTSNGVLYLDVNAGDVYTSDADGNWAEFFALVSDAPTPLGQDIWIDFPAGALFDNNDNDFYMYRFDGYRGPCSDAYGTNSCNSELTGWFIAANDVASINSERIFVPVGMPAASNIGDNATEDSNMDRVAQNALTLNSSGIKAEKLHNDHISIYALDIYENDDNACGSMLTGGSYESGDTAGIYSSQFTPCNSVNWYSKSDSDHRPSSTAVGFRCVGKINY